MGTMEDLIRRIVREEISRAFTAAEQVADGADMPYETGEIESTALTAISKVMERVARDVLANKHPVLSTEHASTEVVHVVTTAQARKCSVCSHPEHDQSKCMYAVPGGACTCLASRTLGAQSSTPSTDECAWCGHASHDEHIGLSCDCGCSGASTCTYCYHLHTGPESDCVAPVGKYTCPCPFAGGRP